MRTLSFLPVILLSLPLVACVAGSDGSDDACDPNAAGVVGALCEKKDESAAKTPVETRGISTNPSGPGTQGISTTPTGPGIQGISTVPSEPGH